MQTGAPHGHGRDSYEYLCASSDPYLVENLQVIIHLDALVSQRRFPLGVSVQQLHGSKVFGASVDERCLVALH
jgi:hypothetical protein